MTISNESWQIVISIDATIMMLYTESGFVWKKPRDIIPVFKIAIDHTTESTTVYEAASRLLEIIVTMLTVHAAANDENNEFNFSKRSLLSNLYFHIRYENRQL